MMTSFGEKLKAIRLAFDLSQDALAKKLGTTKQSISRYETGINSPRIASVETIAQKLGIDLSLLVDRKVTAAMLLDALQGASKHNLIKLERRTLPLLRKLRDSHALLTETAWTDIVESLGEDGDFAFRAHGDSMIDAGIHEGDLLFVRKQSTVSSGEIGLVLIGGKLVVRRIYLRKKLVILSPANAKYQPTCLPVDTDELLILGKVIASKHYYR